MIPGMDAVFKALADSTRRSLLDELFELDGQTLSALERRLPMTRFGVMKHLRVLEEAGLVTTQRPLPEPRPDQARPRPLGEQIRRALGGDADRAQEATGGLDMESSTGKRPWTASPDEKVFEIYIKTTPERLWEAITDGEMRSKYNFGARVSSDWKPGSRYEMTDASGNYTISGLPAGNYQVRFSAPSGSVRCSPCC